MDKVVMDKVHQWLSSKEVDDNTKNLLRRTDEEQLLDWFSQDLTFGTGGLRGVLGIGTNRMNVYTVRRATQGLSDYLLKTALPKKVAIAYDSRHHSLDFAIAAAEVLAGSNIEVIIYPKIEPTPALSYTIRDQKCGAGVCITASHNPAIYNGYKVYGADGSQITLQVAQLIQSSIDHVEMFGSIRRLPFENGLANGLIHYTEQAVLDRFIETELSCILRPKNGLPELEVVYTPLHGAGLECVCKALEQYGVKHLHLVEEQASPDGDFPTCPYPNPEFEAALEIGLQKCKATQADLLLATDPDCDRLGIAVRTHTGDYTLLSGNEVGILLLDYLCKTRIEQGTMPAHPVAITTVVSSAMTDSIVAKYGVELIRTLTGFKYIGEWIGILEKKLEEDRYIFGFEESYGYLSNRHVRDKDAVNACLLVCEAARWYKSFNMTLEDAIQQLYQEHGYYASLLWSTAYSGVSGTKHMQDLLQHLRESPPLEIGGFQALDILDYQDGLAGLPKTNLLEYRLTDGCKVLIRPSGTEPNLKAYVFASGDSTSIAHQKIQSIVTWLDVVLKCEIH